MKLDTNYAHFVFSKLYSYNRLCIFITSLMNIYFPIILVTAASNESDNVAKSFLQLKLCLENDGKVKNVFTEMTIGQFYKFLHDLEKAKCNLDLLL